MLGILIKWSTCIWTCKLRLMHVLVCMHSLLVLQALPPPSVPVLRYPCSLYCDVFISVWSLQFLSAQTHSSLKAHAVPASAALWGRYVNKRWAPSKKTSRRPSQLRTIRGARLSLRIYTVVNINAKWMFARKHGGSASHLRPSSLSSNQAHTWPSV